MFFQNSNHIKYSWLRNGKLIPEKSNGFRIFSNGTLRIQLKQNPENSEGTYRCLVSDKEKNAILSKECIVTAAKFLRENISTNLIANIGSPLIINCPFQSNPPANISWSFNNKTLFISNFGANQQNR